MVKSRRRNFFIKKDFQARFILRFVIAASAGATVAAALFTYLAGQRLKEVLYSSHITITSSLDLLASSVVSANIAAFVLVVGILVYTINSLGRRIAPPLFSLRMSIERLASGDLADKIVLREGEEFQDLAADLDLMRNGLQQKFIGVKERQEGLLAAAVVLDRAALKGALTTREIDAFRGALSRMKEELNAFTY